MDNNVTRHLNKELNEQDWDIMILHYLGLDHVGHSLGPYSDLMHPKQREMDQIIQQIMTQLTERHQKHGENALFVVCSDHGMNEV